MTTNAVTRSSLLSKSLMTPTVGANDYVMIINHADTWKTL